MMMLKLLLVASIVCIGVESSGLIEVFQWKQIDYYNRGLRSEAEPTAPNYGSDPDRVIFPDGKGRVRREIITSRHQGIGISARSGISGSSANNTSYIPYNNVPMGVTHFNGRVFITIPRRRLGIPSTLNYVDLKAERGSKSPKLHAYPDFRTNALNEKTVSDPNRLISVYRTTADSCRRLWFIDTGMLEYPNNFTQVKRPAIWIIDMTTNAVVRRFQIPTNIVDTGRGLASITVEVNENSCNAAYAYLPDLVNSQLYVYSYAQNRMWAFSHNYFNFDPLGGDLSIGGQNFRWNDGIFSTTLGERNDRGFHDLYFHAMASTNEFVVSTEVLQNEQNSARSEHGEDFRALGSRGNLHQSTMHEFDKRTGVLFYNEIQRNGVGCWNTRHTFSAANHGSVHNDAERMIYPSDLTIDDEGTLWVMSNSMPIFIYSNLDVNNVNFRVWKQNTAEAVKKTICE